MLLTTYYLVFSLFIQSPSFQGQWVSIDDETGLEKSIITLYIENDKLYGRIDKLLLAEDQGKLCVNCEGKEKNQPIEGLVILKGLTFDPEGKVAPLAEISNDPVESDEIVAPPRSIVSAATYKVCHLLLLDPN